MKTAALSISVAALLVLAAPATAATLKAPALQTPAQDATVSALPAFTWAKVRSAATYEVQISADDGFGSIVTGRTATTGNTAFTVTKSVADGRYFWRVRGVTQAGRTGRWSATRRLVKAWGDRPDLFGPVGGIAVAYPSEPLVLRWSEVPGAYKYQVRLASDPALAQSVIGDRPAETSGTSIALPYALPSGRYYWDVTPLDPQKHKGTASGIGTFAWAWDSTIKTHAPVDNVRNAELSWDPVPGATAYEVEVNYDRDWAISSRVCCDSTVATAVTPTALLGNNTYYWRVRAIDVTGNPGQWNEGPQFQKTFDAALPSVPGLRVRDNTDTPLDAGIPSVRHPIFTWDPVPGASGYELQTAPYVQGAQSYCDWSLRRWARTANTAWSTVDDPPFGVKPPGPATWEAKRVRTRSTDPLFSPGATYCARVMAIADFSPTPRADEVTSEWTQIHHGASAPASKLSTDSNAPAFTFVSPAELAVEDPAHDPRMDADDYLTPAHELATPRTPLLTWRAVPGALSYWVVIARDEGFTNVVEVAFTDEPSLAPRATLEDETTRYYWVVLPSTAKNGSAVPTGVAHNNRRAFDKQAAAPAVVPQPETVTTQPTFRWSAVEGAREYRVQAARDAAFGDIIDDVRTFATSYTPREAYPVDIALYWRVRAIDGGGVALKWSQPGSFRRRLPVPAVPAGNPTGGEGIPVLTWQPVQGAIAYDVHVDQSDGTRKDFTTKATAFTPAVFYGTGVWRWQVRAVFPGRLSEAQGAYSDPRPFTRFIPPPERAQALRTRDRVLLSWQPGLMVKGYRVEVSDSSAFTTLIERAEVDLPRFAPDLSRRGYQRGGTLYWRVARLDEGANVGAFSTNQLTLTRKLVIVGDLRLRRGRTVSVSLRITDAGRRAVSRARIRVAGAGISVHRTASSRGLVTLRLRARRRGKVTVTATKRGYAAGRRTLRVR